ncbi:MAG: pyridoxal-phosphate dependent enzyme, partial [Gammaproteobacteria bacterium]|nr:pyridoxal-phosphate dependent enzyme [Gammaproteobacteria bacterium]
MVELKDIQDAAERLSSIIVRTPLISSSVLDELTGGRVLLKAENLQRTGSFKIRGAYNLLSQLTPGQAE